MKEPDVDTMMKWLRDVSEVERRIIVVDSVISDLNNHIKRVGDVKEVRKPDGNSISVGEAIFMVPISFAMAFVPIYVISIIITFGLASVNRVKGFAFLTDPLIIDCVIALIIAIIATICIYRDEARSSRKQGERYKKELAERQSIVQVQLAAVPSMKEQLKSFHAVRNELLKKRSELYCTHYLDKAYRGLAPTAAMYGYLTSGRCICVYGHGGIVDTFVHDQQFSILNQKLDVIISQLDDIRSTQLELARALDKNDQEIKGLRNDIKLLSEQVQGSHQSLMQCQEYAARSLSWIAGIQVYQALR